LTFILINILYVLLSTPFYQILVRISIYSQSRTNVIFKTSPADPPIYRLPPVHPSCNPGCGPETKVFQSSSSSSRVILSIRLGAGELSASWALCALFAPYAFHSMDSVEKWAKERRGPGLTRCALLNFLAWYYGPAHKHTHPYLLCILFKCWQNTLRRG